jgi:hypothetical protein
MKSNRRSFWKGFAVGGLLFAVLGLAYANLLIKGSWVGPALTAYPSSMYAKIYVAMEENRNEAAMRSLRSLAYTDARYARYANCMNEHCWFVPFGQANDDCKVFFESMATPDDWEIHGLDKAREDAERTRTMTPCVGG